MSDEDQGSREPESGIQASQDEESGRNEELSAAFHSPSKAGASPGDMAGTTLNQGGGEDFSQLNQPAPTDNFGNMLGQLWQSTKASVAQARERASQVRIMLPFGAPLFESPASTSLATNAFSCVRDNPHPISSRADRWDG